jgi:hypothetical protein
MPLVIDSLFRGNVLRRTRSIGLNPAESTHADLIENKELICNLTPLESALTKMGGGGYVELNGGDLAPAFAVAPKPPKSLTLQSSRAYAWFEQGWAVVSLYCLSSSDL